MKNKMVTLLRTLFSTTKNLVLQCDDQTFRSIAETPVIHFGPEKFKQLLSRGSKSPLRMRKHKEVGGARAPLANSSKQVSAETDKALRKPITVIWRNKETVSQCEGQNLKPVAYENLIVDFDQGKFEESSLEVVQCFTYGSIGRSQWPRFRSKNQKETPLNRVRG